MCESQMNPKDNKFGIGYVDATENIIQSNRPLVIPAKEAYNITKSAVSDRVIEEIQRINEAIRTAAEGGSYGINLDLLSSEAEELLEDAGYKVLRSFIQNEQAISIQWKEGFRNDQKRSKS